MTAAARAKHQNEGLTGTSTAAPAAVVLGQLGPALAGVAGPIASSTPNATRQPGTPPGNVQPAGSASAATAQQNQAGAQTHAADKRDAEGAQLGGEPPAKMQAIA